MSFQIPPPPVFMFTPPPAPSPSLIITPSAIPVQPVRPAIVANDWRRIVEERYPLFHIYPPPGLSHTKSIGAAVRVTDAQIVANPTGIVFDLAPYKVQEEEILIVQCFALKANRTNGGDPPTQIQEMVEGAMIGKIKWAPQTNEKPRVPQHNSIFTYGVAGSPNQGYFSLSAAPPPINFSQEGYELLRRYGYFCCGIPPMIIHSGCTFSIWLNIISHEAGEVINADGVQFVASWEGYTIKRG